MTISPETVFSITNTTALVGWLFLIFVPKSTITQIIIRSGLLSVVLSAIYFVLFALFAFRGDGDFSSLNGVKLLFQNDWILLGGWIHYLAFDLLIGVYIVRISEKTGQSRIITIPCLVLTFLLGPIGYLAHRASLLFSGAKNEI